MKNLLLISASLLLLLAAWVVFIDHSRDVPRLPSNMSPEGQRRSAPPPGAVPFGAPEPAASGASLFTARCVACHGATGDGVSYTASRPEMPAVGDLTRSSQTAEEQYETIRAGQGTMPMFEGRLSPAEMKNLVDFLQAIKKL
ncbi:MAG: cytochrome c [Akkermansia muciniphila]|nr:cytochrome c [Akkermansia muciniphila]